MNKIHTHTIKKIGKNYDQTEKLFKDSYIILKLPVRWSNDIHFIWQNKCRFINENS